jgi:hypothetical protein
VGTVLNKLSPDTDKSFTLPRATGPHPDFTECVQEWDVHHLIHGPRFRIKTGIKISNEARLCCKKGYNFSDHLKQDAFERHSLECAFSILQSVGALPTSKVVTEVCPTCSHETSHEVELPEQGSGFFERVGRYPNHTKDRWRLMYRNGRLIRYIKVNENEAYWDSEFRLVIDDADGSPSYWRLDPRPWYLK